MRANGASKQAKKMFEFSHSKTAIFQYFFGTSDTV